MAQDGEQDRSEAPTPFKLRKGRERGMVARSPELGFLAGLVALVGFALMAGPATVATLDGAMRMALSGGIARAAAGPQGAAAMLGELGWTVLAPLALFGGTLMAVVLLMEIVQLRGIVLTFYPLKPDWSRLNPAKGLKRLFTMRLLKETLKNILKLALYAAATALVVRATVREQSEVAMDGQQLGPVLRAEAMRLILAVLLVAIVVAILDQLLVRREFTRQMRMSRREVTRETRDREGDPRIRQRRRRLHRERLAQSKGDLAGADLLVVNPEHFAVALRYDDGRMVAPEVATKGRNAQALALRDQAFRRGIPVLARPSLARALFAACEIGAVIPPDHYEAVAQLYIDLRRARAAQPQA